MCNSCSRVYIVQGMCQEKGRFDIVLGLEGFYNISLERRGGGEEGEETNTIGLR